MVKKVLKYDGLIQEFIREKIEDPRLSISQFCKNKNIPYESFKKILGKNPKIMERILNGVRKRYHGRSLEIDEVLYQKALQGDPRAPKLWDKRMGAWKRLRFTRGF